VGRSGFSVSLERDKDAAPLGKLREVVLEFLFHQWVDLLGQQRANQALPWVADGESSLLTIGDSDADDDAPADELAFWFYRNAEWPIERAEHWVTGALVAGREELAEILATIGYRLGDDCPTPEMVLGEHDDLHGPDSREPIAQKDCRVCRHFSSRTPG
jgi:hypothetical protein